MKQLPQYRISPRLRQAIERHLRSRTTDQPVSMVNALRQIRLTIPGLELSDDDLELTIAREILRHRGNIAFDRRN